MKFKDLKLSNELLDAITKIGYDEATKIQEMSIPVILEKKDIIGIAQTGTGKTAAYSLPLIERLIREENADRKLKLLILSPTRELALQIRDNIRDYAVNTKFKCSVVLGGVNMMAQIKVLKAGVDILVATPGRLIDLMNKRAVNLSNVKMLVLDEADTMLDMGFIGDMRKIAFNCPSTRQTLLFSATISGGVKEIAATFLNNPVTVKAPSEELTAEKIDQYLYYVDKKNKFNLLLNIMKENKMNTVLIFTRTKRGANKLQEQLEEYGIHPSVIHGDKTQSNRVKALADFKKGRTNYMIATDIAARGIDVSGITHVINYDMPEQPELYVHRIGRTARAGTSGVSIALCTSEERRKLKDIERLIHATIQIVDHEFPMVEDNREERSVHNKGNKAPFKRNVDFSDRPKRNFGRSDDSKNTFGRNDDSKRSYGRNDDSRRSFSKPSGENRNRRSNHSTGNYNVKRTNHD